MAQTVVQNRDRSQLSTEQLRAAVPSIFAEEAHDSRSNRYLYVPTIRMVEALGEEGFVPVWASQAKTRDASRTNFTKHMIRFRHVGDEVGALATLRSQYGAHHMIQRSDALQSPVWAEIILTNAHDGSSSVQESSGLFRYACSNGLIVGAGGGDNFRFNHTNKWRDDIIEGAYRVIENVSGPVMEQVGEMQGRQLTQPERLLLAEHAAGLRWPDREAPIQPAQLLATRRSADRADDAFTTLNVLQENVIRGGLPYRGEPDRFGRRDFRHTRTVTGIDDLGRLNRGIWDAVATLTTGNRVDLAREMMGRLSPEERAQLALTFA